MDLKTLQATLTTDTRFTNKHLKNKKIDEERKVNGETELFALLKIKREKEVDIFNLLVKDDL